MVKPKGETCCKNSLANFSPSILLIFAVFAFLFKHLKVKCVSMIEVSQSRHIYFNASSIEVNLDLKVGQEVNNLVNSKLVQIALMKPIIAL